MQNRRNFWTMKIWSYTIIQSKIGILFQYLIGASRALGGRENLPKARIGLEAARRLGHALLRSENVSRPCILLFSHV